jgi:hypothetical protein
MLIRLGKWVVLVPRQALFKGALKIRFTTIAGLPISEVREPHGPTPFLSVFV